MNEDTLQLQARFDRTLVRQHHKSVRYLVVETTAPPPEQEAREMPPWDAEAGHQDAKG